MKVTGLKIENYRKIAVLDIGINGDVKVKGKNGTGKSTVLDAIYYAITGGKLNMDKPIKEGEKKAVIELTLEGENRKLEITRTITDKSNSLKVVDNGEKKARPADILATLLNKVSVDPQKFLELSKKEQVEIMAKVCEVDFDFEKEFIEEEKDIEERRICKRDINDYKANIASLNVPDDVPDDVPSIQEVTKELQEAMTFNANIESKKNREQSLRDEGAKIKERFEQIKRELQEIGELPEKKDIESINAKMHLANSASEIIRKKEIKEKLSIAANKLQLIEKKIKDRSKAKENAFQKANIPVEGLTTDGEKLLLNGIPFDQSSTAERIKVSTSLAVMANKDLKLINIKDAILLDSETMEAVSKVAKENDCQLFMEMVSEDEDVVIEFVANEAKVDADIEREPCIVELNHETMIVDDHLEDNLDMVEEDESYNDLTDKILSKDVEEHEEEEVCNFPDEETPTSNLFDELDDL